MPMSREEWRRLTIKPSTQDFVEHFVEKRSIGAARSTKAADKVSDKVSDKDAIVHFWDKP